MAEITLTKKKFGSDDELDSVKFWQEQGIPAIWQAMWEATTLGYAIRGKTINYNCRDKISKQRVPWLSGGYVEEES